MDNRSEFKELLLVGDASSIFLINYVRALKQKIDVKVSVYSPVIERPTEEIYPYDDLFFDHYEKTWIGKLVFFRSRLQAFFNRYRFGQYLKKQNKVFDIIHFHWIIPAWVISPSLYKKYGKKIGTTFWGGELDTLLLLDSHQLYMKSLQKFLSLTDFCVGATVLDQIQTLCPSLKNKCYYGIFGSSIIEEISKLEISNEEAKQMLNIPQDKITILLGYSGKTIHRHIDILHAIVAHPQFERYKSRLHFMASMTRGATPSYIEEVRDKLSKTGCSYTLICNSYQTDKDVAVFRLATDIAFQLSTFDGLSSSIKEILIAGSVLICGNWFPSYYMLKNDGFKYLEVPDIKYGIDMMYQVVEGENTKIGLQNNKEIGVKKYLWSECINNFIDAYKKQFAI